MIAQAYRFSKDKFTAAQAKKWLKDHKVSYLSFDAAAEAKAEEEEAKTGARHSTSDMKLIAEIHSKADEIQQTAVALGHPTNPDAPWQPLKEGDVEDEMKGLTKTEPDAKADVSLDEKVREVRECFYGAFKPQVMPEMTAPSPWIREVYEDSVVAEVGEKTYRIPYTLDADGKPTFAAQADWEEVEMEYVPVKADDMLAVYGSAVKAGEDGHLGGYLVRFGSPTQPDSTGDYFTRDTEFGFYNGMKTPVYFHHTLPLKTGKGTKTVQIKERIGEATLTEDEEGVLIDAILFNASKWKKTLMKAVKSLGWSSGTAPHLVERTQVGGVFNVKRWPLGLDASLTPIPAEPRNEVQSVKSMPEMTLADELEPEAEGTVSAAEGEKKDVGNVGTMKEDFEMEAKDVQQMIADGLKAALDVRDQAAAQAAAQAKAVEDAKKAADAELDAKIAAGVKAGLQSKKPVNAGGQVGGNITKTPLGDDAHKAFNWFLKTGDSSGIRTGEAYDEWSKQKAVKTEYDLLESTQYQGQEAVPTEVVAKIIEKRDPISVVRAAGAEIIQVGTNSVVIPIEGHSPSAIAPAAVDGTTDFLKEQVTQMDKLAQKVYLFPCRTPMDIQLLDDAAFDVESWLSRRAGRAMGVTENYYFAIGNGTTAPQGFVTGSAKGWDNLSATVYTFTDVNKLYASLASEYRDNVSWFCTGADEGLIRSLTGTAPYFVGNGGTSGGVGNYGYPQGAGGFIAPNSKVFNVAAMDTIAGGKQPLVCANMAAGYAVLDRKILTILRDPYSLGGYGMVQFITYFRVGGGVTNSAAIKHLLTPTA